MHRILSFRLRRASGEEPRPDFGGFVQPLDFLPLSCRDSIGLSHVGINLGPMVQIVAYDRVNLFDGQDVEVVSDLFRRGPGKERANNAFQWYSGAGNVNRSTIHLLKWRRIGVYLQSHLITPYLWARRVRTY